MNNALITLILSLHFITSNPQNLNYNVHRRYNRPLLKEKLTDAKYLSDFIPDYPKNWISNYISVEILANSYDQAMKAMSSNDLLSKEQKNILNTADLGTDITINVNYKYKNSATDDIENHTMNVSMTVVSETPVVPEKEAEYVGGYHQLTKYLDENAIHKISVSSTKQIKEGTITFTVNERGEIVDPKISKTTGELRADKLLLETISKMPKWNPAKNSMGKKVKQEFELTIGNEGC